MNEFVGTVPFLRIVFGFDMKTMHFRIAKTGLFFGHLVFAFRGVTINKSATIKIVLGCKVGQISYRTYSVSVEI